MVIKYILYLYLDYIGISGDLNWTT